MSTYRLVLDPEGAAILDAAIDPLARPQRHPDGGGVDSTGFTESTGVTDSTDSAGVTGGSGRAGGVEPDLRTAAARRADALLAIVGRGLIARRGAEDCQGRRGRHPRLRHPGRPAHGLGQRMPRLRRGTDEAHRGRAHPRTELLSPGTVRRLACEADIIPMVLGTDSEVLDVNPHQAARAARDPPCGPGSGTPGAPTPPARSPRSGATRTTPSWWRGRRDLPGQYRPPLRAAPHPRPRQGGLHHRRYRCDLAPVTPQPHARQRVTRTCVAVRAWQAACRATARAHWRDHRLGLQAPAWCGRAGSGAQRGRSPVDAKCHVGVHRDRTDP